MKRGEVWWVEFDPALGTEIKKARPAVIVSNDAANRNLARVVVVPLTSNTEKAYPGEALVSVAGQAQDVGNVGVDAHLRGKQALGRGGDGRQAFRHSSGGRHEGVHANVAWQRRAGLRRR